MTKALMSTNERLLNWTLFETFSFMGADRNRIGVIKEIFEQVTVCRSQSLLQIVQESSG